MENKNKVEDLKKKLAEYKAQKDRYESDIAGLEQQIADLSKDSSNEEKVSATVHSAGFDIGTAVAAVVDALVKFSSVLPDKPVDSKTVARDAALAIVDMVNSNSLKKYLGDYHAELLEISQTVKNVVTGKVIPVSDVEMFGEVPYKQVIRIVKDEPSRVGEQPTTKKSLVNDYDQKKISRKLK